PTRIPDAAASSPISDGDRRFRGIPRRRSASFDHQVLSAFRTDSQVDARQIQGRRTGGERRSVLVEVLEEKAGRVPVATVTAVGTAQRLDRAASRSTEGIAAPVPQIPFTIRSTVKAISAAPDESHRSAGTNVGAQWSLESQPISLQTGREIGGPREPGCQRTARRQRTRAITGYAMPFP